MSLLKVYDSIIDLLHKKEYDYKNLLAMEQFQEIKVLLKLFDVKEEDGFKEWMTRCLKKNSYYLPTNVDYDVEFIADSIMLTNITENIDVSHQLKRLEKVGKSHAQRTPEWYAFRHRVITASSLGKIFESESSNYSFLKEKVILDRTFFGTKATEFGKRFEETAQKIYEDVTQTKVSEYGCVPHSSIPHIGASPDGIVTETYKDEYLLGRMLEIKCLYSRTLTGLPKYLYWVQCQIQLEVCDLEYCDFFECNMKEYDTISDLNEALEKKNFPYFGILIELIDENKEKVRTLVSDIKNTKESVNMWYEENVDTAINSGYSIVFKGWSLEKYSRLTIKRNRDWFDSVRGKISDFWTNVLETRVQFEKDDKYFNKLDEKRKLAREQLKAKKSKTIPNNTTQLEENTEWKSKKTMTFNDCLALTECLIEDSD